MTIDRRRFLQLTGGAAVASQLGACGPGRIPASDVPLSSFDQNSTADDVTAGMNLRGRYAVITGCTSGIGYETMRVLASRGAVVVGTSRSLQRAESACRSVIGTTIPAQMDLGVFDSVVACAEHIRSMRIPIDMLICNAGYLGGSNERQLINGIEKHFAINHLGHFIFVNRVLDRLYIAEQGRIVMTASRTAYTRAPDRGILFDDMQFADDYGDFMAYGHSKLATVLFSLDLAGQLRGTRITTNSMHPGVVDTNIRRHTSRVKRMGLKLATAIAGKTVEEGAATGCYIATSEQLAAVSGKYFEDCNAIIVGGEHHLYDAVMAERLMQVSQEMTAEYLIEQKVPEVHKPEENSDAA